MRRFSQPPSLNIQEQAILSSKQPWLRCRAPAAPRTHIFIARDCEAAIYGNSTAGKSSKV
jgi:hypothetical protein